jgi:N-formylglutamate amidohydrolase
MTDDSSLRPPVEPVVERIEPAVEPLPLVFDSPHSGREFPEDFSPVAPMRMLRGSIDDYVDELFAAAPEHGAVLIHARFPRVYVDPNRDDADIDLALLEEAWPGPHRPSIKQRFGKTLIWRTVGSGVAIYDRPLTVAEVAHRIEHYWRPYHECVRGALDEAYARAGQVWHVNCHSMASRAGSAHPDNGRERPDVTVSDRKGESCAPRFLECVVETLRGLGYKVGVNDPYFGMELIARYCDPAAGRHSLQVEVKRALYMHERNRERHDGFATLQHNLDQLCAAVAEFARAEVD